MGSEATLREAAHKVYEILKDHFWTEGGFLQAVGEGFEDDRPAVVVYLARKLWGHEERLVPKEMDGVLVVTKFIGKVVVRAPRRGE